MRLWEMHSLGRRPRRWEVETTLKQCVHLLALYQLGGIVLHEKVQVQLIYSEASSLRFAFVFQFFHDLFDS